MNDLIWFLLIGVVVIAVIILVRRSALRPYTRTETNELKPGLLKDMLDHATHINDYFANAVRVWLFAPEESARLAALTAAKVAAGVQRASMGKYLSAMADDLSTMGAKEKALVVRIAGLASAITKKDWDLADVREAKRELAALDREYAEALDRADPKVFERRHPSLFES